MNQTDLVDALKFYRSFIQPEIARIYWTIPRSEAKAPLEHVHAAVRWLFRAQDAFSAGGVARSYSIAYNRYFKRRGPRRNRRRCRRAGDFQHRPSYFRLGPIFQGDAERKISRRGCEGSAVF